MAWTFAMFLSISLNHGKNQLPHIADADERSVTAAETMEPRSLVELPNHVPLPSLLRLCELDLAMQFSLYQSRLQLLEFVLALVQIGNRHTNRRMVAFKFYQC